MTRMTLEVRMLPKVREKAKRVREPSTTISPLTDTPNDKTVPGTMMDGSKHLLDSTSGENPNHGMLPPLPLYHGRIRTLPLLRIDAQDGALANQLREAKDIASWTTVL